MQCSWFRRLAIKIKSSQIDIWFQCNIKNPGKLFSRNLKAYSKSYMEMQRIYNCQNNYERWEQRWKTYTT